MKILKEKGMKVSKLLEMVDQLIVVEAHLKQKKDKDGVKLLSTVKTKLAEVIIQLEKEAA